MIFGWGPNAALVTQPWRSSQLPLSITEFGLNGTPQNFQWMIRDALEDFDFFGWHSHKKMAQTAVSSNTWAVGSCLKKLFEPFQLHQNQRFMQKEFFWNRGWWDFCAIVWGWCTWRCFLLHKYTGKPKMAVYYLLKRLIYWPWFTNHLLSWDDASSSGFCMVSLVWFLLCGSLMVFLVP